MSRPNQMNPSWSTDTWARSKCWLYATEICMLACYTAIPDHDRSLFNKEKSIAIRESWHICYQFSFMRMLINKNFRRSWEQCIIAFLTKNILYRSTFIFYLDSLLLYHMDKEPGTIRLEGWGRGGWSGLVNDSAFDTVLMLGDPAMWPPLLLRPYHNVRSMVVAVTLSFKGVKI